MPPGKPDETPSCDDTIAGVVARHAVYCLLLCATRTWARPSAGFLKRLGAADERGYARPVRHRAGRSARRGAALTPGLPGAAPAGGAEAGPGEARPDARGDGVGP